MNIAIFYELTIEQMDFIKFLGEFPEQKCADDEIRSISDSIYGPLFGFDLLKRLVSWNNKDKNYDYFIQLTYSGYKVLESIKQKTHA